MTRPTARNRTWLWFVLGVLTLLVLGIVLTPRFLDGFRAGYDSTR